MSPLRKSNSCSTIFLDDSTISQPNLKNTIKCISLAIYYHIINRKNRADERLMEIFEERLHPITVNFANPVRTQPQSFQNRLHFRVHSYRLYAAFAATSPNFWCKNIDQNNNNICFRYLLRISQKSCLKTYSADLQRDPVPIEVISKDPDHRQIYRFIRALFHAAQLTAECAIITLVRLRTFSQLSLELSNY